MNLLINKSKRKHWSVQVGSTIPTPVLADAGKREVTSSCTAYDYEYFLVVRANGMLDCTGWCFV